jgi:NAD(P)-dependent dehydrogenase (short-subunit alcohol dehydrogenase family)
MDSDQALQFVAVGVVAAITGAACVTQQSAEQSSNSRASSPADAAAAIDTGAPQRVLVTGGANGIGRGIVDRFIEDGASVVFVDLVATGAAVGFGGASSSAPAGAHFIRCDVSDPNQIDAAVSKAIAILGGLDVLVNNVGIHVEAGKPCHEVSLEAWDRMIAVNLRSYFLFCKFVLRDAFVPQRSGAIVNIGSVHGFQNGPGLPSYAATKGGILAFTRQLAVEYAPLGIRANVVVPGTINTPMNLNFMTEEDERTDRSPMGRWGMPGEVAEAVVFLASRRAGFITGESLAADGGLLAKGTWADNERPGLADSDG